MKMINAKCSLLFLLLAGGGAVAHAEKSHTDVPQTIAERTGSQIRPGGDDAETHAIIRKLLHRELTAGSAARIALLNNPSLQATMEDIGISQADLREAGLLRNPEFAGSIRFPDRPDLVSDLEGSLAQDFLNILVLPLRKRIAAAQLEQTKLRVANEVLGLVADTKAAFYDLQGQMELLERSKLILDASQAAVELAQKQHEAGNTTDLMLANEQAAYSQARLEVAMVGAEIREKREKLNRLMGAWGADTDWKAAAKLPPVPATDFPAKGLESLAVRQRLDLAAARSGLASIVQALGLTKTYRFVGALEIGIDSERNSDRSTVTGPTLRVELPLFNQGQARMAKGEAQLRQAERRLQALAIEIRSEVREKRDRLATKRDIAKFYRDEMIPERGRIVSLIQLRYNGMLTGVFDLLQAKQGALKAEQGYIEAARDYWIARTELERTTGGSLEAKKETEGSKETKTASTRNSH